jgi:2-methylcitrate dehydratase PrpD
MPALPRDVRIARDLQEDAMTGLAHRIGTFVAGLETAKLPPEVTEKARVCLLNAYGIGLGSHDTPYAPVARAAALALDGERADGATMLGDGRKTTIGGACLANSALFHGRAQEDSSGAAHLGTVVVPLLTAMIEARRLALADLIPALVAAYEVGGLFERAYAIRTTPAGFRSTTTYGAIAAAAAASRLMRLDGERTGAAIANAVSFTGGVLQSFSDGTDEWRYQPGIVARNGLVAAELAKAGSVSAPHAFEGRNGLVRAFAREDCDVEGLAGTLGLDWLIHRVTFKPYPVCAFNQTPVTAALELRGRIARRAVRSARVRMNPYETGYAGMDSKGPFSTIGGTLMSIPFCIALTLLRGDPTMQAMTTYDDGAVNALVDRIDLISDEGVARLCCIIDVELEDGSTETIDKRVTTDDFNFDRAGVSALVRRIGREQGVPAEAYDLVERFADTLPDGEIGLVLSAFALCPSSRGS